MASLLLPPPPSPATAIHTANRSSSRPPLRESSHFLTHAERCHRLQIFSAAGKHQNPSNNVESSTGKVDRRNILLGIGGLYGAGSLMSIPTASASPVLAPEDFKNCVPSDEPDMTDVKCCLINQDVTDYKLPEFKTLKTRNSAHHASTDYISDYNKAISRMKKLPDSDPRSFMNQANIHCAYCDAFYYQGGTDDKRIRVHSSWLFFPFHRWYLYFYERILGNLIDDPTFALPFWNWDNEEGMAIPPIFDDDTAALYDGKREQTHRPPAIVDLGLTAKPHPPKSVRNNIAEMHKEMVSGNSTVFDFMGQPYRSGDAVSPGPGSSERGSHNSVHDYVGDSRQRRHEDMGTFYSAGRDPIFFAHHGNIDRMWTLWQNLPPKIAPAYKKIDDPDFLNSTFLFYDENSNLVRVSVKDCVDNERMGYKYETVVTPWLDYMPPMQSPQARSKRLSALKAPKATELFPLNLDRIVRFEVDKTAKGKADESLVVENIVADVSKFVKFDVFVNEEEDVDEVETNLDNASYAGTFSQVPHGHGGNIAPSSIKLRLTDLYDYMDVDEDESVVVTLVPRHDGPGVTIGGIKIIAN